MVNILPIRHGKAADWLRGSIRSQGAQVAVDLKERMAAVLEEGEEPPDVEHFMDVLGRMVKRESEMLDAADEIRLVEGGEVRWLLGQRDEADAEVRSIVIAIRNRMRGFYGAKKANRLLGIEGRTPLNTEDLESMADRLVLRLADTRLPPVDGCVLDASAWADKLRPARQRLIEVIDEIHQRRCRMRAGGIAKNQALKISAKTYSRIVRLLELIYQLSGHERLARRLRRKVGGRRPGKGKSATMGRPESVDTRDRLLSWLGNVSEPAHDWLAMRRRGGGPRVA